MGYQYVASPYTHSDPAVRLYRVRQSALACAHMVLEGANPYSPLVHCDAIERLSGKVVDYDVWIRHCLAMLSKADTFYIIPIEGWSISKGVAIEKKFAESYGIPISFLSLSRYCQEFA